MLSHIESDSCCWKLWKVRDEPLPNMIALIVLIGSIVAIFIVIQPEYHNQLVQFCVVPISISLLMLALMHVTACLMHRKSHRSIAYLTPLNRRSIAILEVNPQQRTPVSNNVDRKEINLPASSVPQPIGGPVEGTVTKKPPTPKQIVTIPIPTRTATELQISRQSSSSLDTGRKPPTPPGDKDLEGWDTVTTVDQS